MNHTDIRKLICCVGLPRSGKTTWAMQQGFPVVCPDAIRLALHGERYVAQAEPWVWALAHTMVEALFLAGHKHVILDACQGSQKRREEWESTKWFTYYRVFNTDVSECVKRAYLTDDMYIIPVIDRMAGTWEPLPMDALLWGQEHDPVC